MKSGIYKITNNTTGKFYIGSAKNIDERWNDHRIRLNNNNHCNPKLQHSWNFYGGDKFEFIILEEVEPIKEKLFEREQYYLDTFKPYIRGLGYNICDIAAGGDNITHHPNRNAFIEKMSKISAGENNPMFGRNHTDDTIKLQKDKAKGRFTLDWFILKYGQIEGLKKFDERRLMLSNRIINYSHPNSMKGKIRGKMGEDAKQRLKDSKFRMRTQKKELISDIQAGNLSIPQIAEKYNIAPSSVKYHKSKLKNQLIN